jgi:hypothetical protein
MLHGVVQQSGAFLAFGAKMEVSPCIPTRSNLGSISIDRPTFLLPLIISYSSTVCHLPTFN